MSASRTRNLNSTLAVIAALFTAGGFVQGCIPGGCDPCADGPTVQEVEPNDDESQATAMEDGKPIFSGDCANGVDFYSRPVEVGQVVEASDDDVKETAVTFRLYGPGFDLTDGPSTGALLVAASVTTSGTAFLVVTCDTAGGVSYGGRFEID